MLKSILIVDDSPVARMIMKKCLPADHGLTIYEAANGQEGISQYEAHKPDVTFMDLTMPVMDGFQALAEIKQKYPQAVVIVATADIQEKVLSRVATLGALHTIKKPPSKSALQEALDLAESALPS
ncbi:response regulator [Desulfuromonas acetoxidans]|uniref:Response regulator receiver protein n=1 Tax=Desulfuromonas acetoxidans (strain DSM 684 / 11070) TaxID=281689 RepID=Q1JWK4_DESA6|nr:response regulator [Desulfuromonas acetoxidans]EAT14675.1 response regulator receiver protein [Desulfuromonas acetoxidans DSM 684]MBF0645031.1 response regulator [Desulfuromonas acetoxidans]NVD23159.1 response regulator [Desulfuromonas acetoxidans]NVE15600.1 response regulator [Desulfuromonas acetoxidans]